MQHHAPVLMSGARMTSHACGIWLQRCHSLLHAHACAWLQPTWQRHAHTATSNAPSGAQQQGSSAPQHARLRFASAASTKHKLREAALEVVSGIRAMLAQPGSAEPTVTPHLLQLLVCPGEVYGNDVGNAAQYVLDEVAASFPPGTPPPVLVGAVLQAAAGGTSYEAHSPLVSLLAAHMPGVTLTPFHTDQPSLPTLPPGTWSHLMSRVMQPPSATGAGDSPTPAGQYKSGAEDNSASPAPSASSSTQAITTGNAATLVTQWRARGGGSVCALLLSTPSFAGRVEKLLSRVEAVLPGLPVVGGVSWPGAWGSDTYPPAGCVFLGPQAYTGGAVGVLLDGDFWLDTLVTPGYRTVGPVMHVTSADGNVVMGLDGGPPTRAVQRALTAALNAPDGHEFVGGGFKMGITPPAVTSHIQAAALRASQEVAAAAAAAATWAGSADGSAGSTGETRGQRPSHSWMPSSISTSRAPRKPAPAQPLSSQQPSGTRTTPQQPLSGTPMNIHPASTAAAHRQVQQPVLQIATPLTRSWSLVAPEGYSMAGRGSGSGRGEDAALALHLADEIATGSKVQLMAQDYPAAHRAVRAALRAYLDSPNKTATEHSQPTTSNCGAEAATAASPSTPFTEDAQNVENCSTGRAAALLFSCSALPFIEHHDIYSQASGVQVAGGKVEGEFLTHPHHHTCAMHAFTSTVVFLREME